VRYRARSSLGSPPLPVLIERPLQGIRYADLSEEEKERWDATEWSDDDTDPPPDSSSATQPAHRSWASGSLGW